MVDVFWEDNVVAYIDVILHVFDEDELSFYLLLFEIEKIVFEELKKRIWLTEFTRLAPARSWCAKVQGVALVVTVYDLCVDSLEVINLIIVLDSWCWVHISRLFWVYIEHLLGKYLIHQLILLIIQSESLDIKLVFVLHLKIFIIEINSLPCFDHHLLSTIDYHNVVLHLHHGRL